MGSLHNSTFGTLLVIARHGNTFERGETPLRIGARTDLPLTVEGLLQAHNLGQHFADMGWEFSRCYASPLLRTQQSADAILTAQAVKLQPIMADFLREIDHGPDEATADADIVARLGKDALRDWDQRGVVPQGWVAHAEERTAAWGALLREALSAGRSERWLFVTSNGAARFALVAAAQLGVGIPSDLKLPTGGYGQILCDRAGGLRVENWGRRP